MTTATEVLSVEGLQIVAPGVGVVVEEYEVTLYSGEILGLVGESGSGKTSSALALLGYHKPGLRIAHGSMKLGGAHLTIGDVGHDIRGRLIAYVPQDPGPSLNPSLRVGNSIEDIVAAHRPGRLHKGTAREMLALVGLPATKEFARRFPHQLSGGQQQRVCIALALACEPAVLVLDEPTTGLDVVTQAHILDVLTGLRDERGLAMVYVTHDLGVIAQIADRVMVMYSGWIVEQGATEQVLAAPRHPYTRGLLAATPDHRKPHALHAMPGLAPGIGERPTGCAFAPRCPQRIEQCDSRVPPLAEIGSGRSVRCIRGRETPPLDAVGVPTPSPAATAHPSQPILEVRSLCADYRSRREHVIAASDVSFQIGTGECVSLVGESGSGKTTIARVIAGLHQPRSGELRLAGEPLAAGPARTREQHRRVQYVFQNSSEALNPRHSVNYLIGRPLKVLRRLGRDECSAEVRRALELARLPSRCADRLPTELSGGERQRVALARALAARPDLIICDEITSALDVSVQAAVIDLLGELRRELGLSLLFITHDLSVVASIADRMLVLDRGTVCEQGPTVEVISDPQHEYTRLLLASAPSITAGRSQAAPAHD